MAELTFRVHDLVAHATINRPKSRNSLSVEVLESLRDAVREANARDDVRVLVITGAGDRAFSAGADLRSIGPLSATEAHDARGLLVELFRELWAIGKPTIARVRGFALAGGFGLALSCDFVVAADDAQFGTPEVDVGLWPFVITVPLLRSMPPRLAFELMATGRRMSAEEALRGGVVNSVVPASRLDEEVDRLAQSLCEKSPLVLRYGRRSFRRALEMDDDEALEYLQGMLTLTLLSEDTKEGIAAFVEKRKPQWRGH